MVRYQAVVVELGGVAGFGARQEIEKVAKLVLCGEEELAVVAAGDEVVTGAILELAWVAWHGILGDTI